MISAITRDIERRFRSSQVAKKNENCATPEEIESFSSKLGEIGSKIHLNVDKQSKSFSKSRIHGVAAASTLHWATSSEFCFVFEIASSCWALPELSLCFPSGIVCWTKGSSQFRRTRCNLANSSSSSFCDGCRVHLWWVERTQSKELRPASF